MGSSVEPTRTHDEKNIIKIYFKYITSCILLFFSGGKKNVENITKKSYKRKSRYVFLVNIKIIIK